MVANSNSEATQIQNQGRAPKLTHSERARRRRMMGQAVLRGESPEVVASRFRVCVATVKSATSEVRAAKDAALEKWYEANLLADPEPRFTH